MMRANILYLQCIYLLIWVWQQFGTSSHLWKLHFYVKTDKLYCKLWKVFILKDIVMMGTFIQFKENTFLSFSS